MAGAILQLKALGIDNVLRFPFLSAPPARSMMQALELLHAIDTLDADGRLTEKGVWEISLETGNVCLDVCVYVVCICRVASLRVLQRVRKIMIAVT